MRRAFVSVRGYVERPCVLEVDLAEERVSRKIEVEINNLEHVPFSKRGFSGLRLHNGRLYAATWDRICLIDPENGCLLDMIEDKRFSDIHGIFVEQDGTIWLANTNLDGIYTVREGKVEAFWHAWECKALGQTLTWVDQDYSHVIKRESPFHRYHVNSVFVTTDHVLVSYLGRPVELGRWPRMLTRWGMRERQFRDGGIFVIDRNTGQLIRNIPSEGLHDPAFGPNSELYYSEYFGNALLRVDLHDWSIWRIPLDMTPLSGENYLTRAVMVTEDDFWVGHTQHRGWHTHEPVAWIRSYERNGRWQGRGVRLSGYVGVYEIIRVPAIVQPEFAFLNNAVR